MGRCPPIGIIGSISDQHKESKDWEPCFGATILIQLGTLITGGGFKRLKFQKPLYISSDP